MSSNQEDDAENNFSPIEDYGVIGNLNTIALVNKTDASIDHFCYPFFDSPMIFGKILGASKGGHFKVAPSETNSRDWKSKQLYLPSSNILITRFLGAAGGIGQVTDFLPVTKAESKIISDFPSGLCVPSSTHTFPLLVRKVEAMRGKIRFRMSCLPAFNYGRCGHSVEVGACKSVCKFTQTNDSGNDVFVQFTLRSTNSKCTLEKNDPEDDKGGVFSEFSLDEQESVYFVFYSESVVANSQDPKVSSTIINHSTLNNLLHLTNYYWRKWIQNCTYTGRWREMVYRSALALKLMTFAPTGAIVASPTTSLPEKIGGTLNWDYRFTWIRDAAFTVYAFLRIGLKDEAADFMHWIECRCEDTAMTKGLRLMYDIRGGHPSATAFSNNPEDNVCHGHCKEIEISNWPGYKKSYPVRIGNQAFNQQQLDIYGELMDSIYLCDKWVKQISFEFWCTIRDKIIPQLLDRYDKPDHGIWEAREEPQHYVYSKVMAWVALDRVIRLANKRSLPCAGKLQQWISTRDAIYEQVMQRGYNSEIGCFTQHYDTGAIDASNLIMPLVFFLAPNDPKFLKTLEMILKPPSAGGLTINNLVFRYHPGHSDLEGTFTICSFWLVEALARAGKYDKKFLERALLIFEDVLGYANHLGLFSEEIGLDGSALGNFPQAFTHLSLISAAFNLDRSLDGD